MECATGPHATGTHAMRECASLAAGFAACEAEACPFPFVVRAPPEFCCASVADIRQALALEREVKGSLPHACGYAYETGEEALRVFDTGRSDGTTMNVIDAECLRNDALLPAVLRELGALVNHHLLLAYVLSPYASGDIGPMHVDPPMGSGWQWLAYGDKTWYVVDDTANLPPLYSRQACRKMNDPPDMAAVALRARVLTCVLAAGDFISFPCGWSHAVSTESASLGLSGYGCIPTPRVVAAAVVAVAAAAALAAVEA